MLGQKKFCFKTYIRVRLPSIIYIYVFVFKSTYVKHMCKWTYVLNVEHLNGSLCVSNECYFVFCFFFFRFTNYAGNSSNQ